MNAAKFTLLLIFIGNISYSQQIINMDNASLRIDGNSVQLIIQKIERHDVQRTFKIMRKPDENRQTGYNNNSYISIYSKAAKTRWTKLSGQYIIIVTSKIGHKILNSQEFMFTVR